MKNKKIRKSLLVLSLVFATSISMIEPAFATSSVTDNATNIVSSGNVTQGIIDLNAENGDFIASDAMSYEDMAKVIAKDQNISVKKAKAMMGTEEKMVSQSVNSSDTVIIQATMYRTITATLNVSSTYKPTLNFYCKTSESGGYWGILSILNVSMNRQYNSTSKQFSGNVYSNLQSAYEIYYVVDGDFYNNGTTTVSGGAEITIGKYGNINFSISNSSNFYKYFYEAKLMTLQY